jgi:hypothetical protein
MALRQVDDGENLVLELREPQGQVPLRVLRAGQHRPLSHTPGEDSKCRLEDLRVGYGLQPHRGISHEVCADGIGLFNQAAALGADFQ